MKKYLVPICAAMALAFASCSEVDTTQNLNDYSDCVVYAHDTIAGTGCLSDYARIKITGDMVTLYYQVDLDDFKLSEGAPLTSAKVSRLMQFMKDETDDQGNINDIYYYFFKQQENTIVEGDMPMKDMKLGWLSTVYWLSFTSESGPYKVWSLPRRVQMYGNRNLIKSSYGNNEEKAISPRYDLSFNVQKSTVTIKATGVKYPVDNTDPSKSLEFRQIQWNDMPATFTATGFTVNAPEVDVRVDGSADEYTVTNMTGSFDADFDGKRSFTFTLRSKKTGMQLVITTEFDYFIGDQHENI